MNKVLENDKNTADGAMKGFKSDFFCNLDLKKDEC